MMGDLSRRMLLILVLQAVWVPSGESQVVRGVAVDDATRQPVPQAEVVLSPIEGGEPIRERTDSTGAFRVEVPESGAYRMAVRHPSYAPYESEGLELEPDETITVEVRLGLEAIPVQPLLVTARAEGHLAEFERRRRSGGFGRFLTRKDIEDKNAARTSQLLRTMSGITLTEVGRGRGTLVRMHSGIGLCQPAMYVDGVRSQQFRENTIDDFLSPEMLDAVEVYTSSSGTPAMYAADACGVIAFWTRRGERGDGEPWNWTRVLGGFGASLLLLFWIT